MTTDQFQLVVSHAVWREALLPILARRDQVATGVLRRDPARRPIGLLAESLSVGDAARTGSDFPPLADWVAVSAPDGEPPAGPAEWLNRLRPRFAQLLAIVLVGFRRNPQIWRGWTVERGIIRPLAGLSIVGPGMLHVGPTHDLDIAPYPERWSRLRGAVGDAAFAKLRASSVAVVGCSRTGNLAAAMFAALGVRRLVLIDGDVLEPANLDGVILATESDVGTNKAIALGRRLMAFRGDLVVQALPRPLADVRSERALGSVDLIVTCVDQDSARLRAAHVARAQLVPHLDIGTGVTRVVENVGTGGNGGNGDSTPSDQRGNRQAGASLPLRLHHAERDGYIAVPNPGNRQLAADVRLLLPGAGCIRCVGGLADLEQAEYELHAPPGALPRRPPEPWNARGRLGSLITINGIAAATAVQSWLDLLDGTLTASVWHRLRWNGWRGWDWRSAAVGAATDCLLCHRRAA